MRFMRITDLSPFTCRTNATSTEYIYAGDTLLATIDQAMVNNIAVGSNTVRYVHVDNLGSTQATSDSTGNLVQSFSYAPYGAVIAQASANANANLKRGYIGQYSDTSGLNYLNARYYDSARGQLVSQDPVFWESCLRIPISVSCLH
jgi:RHS repeat-associated protein